MWEREGGNKTLLEGAMLYFQVENRKKSWEFKLKVYYIVRDHSYAGNVNCIIKRRNSKVFPSQPKLLFIFSFPITV